MNRRTRFVASGRCICSVTVQKRCKIVSFSFVVRSTAQFEADYQRVPSVFPALWRERFATDDTLDFAHLFGGLGGFFGTVVGMVWSVQGPYDEKPFSFYVRLETTALCMNRLCELYLHSRC